jgi:hypothetical protein
MCRPAGRSGNPRVTASLRYRPTDRARNGHAAYGRVPRLAPCRPDARHHPPPYALRVDFRALFTTTKSRSRLHKGNSVLLHPRDLRRQLVQHTAASDLHLPLRTVGDQPRQMVQKNSASARSLPGRCPCQARYRRRRAASETGAPSPRFRSGVRSRGPSRHAKTAPTPRSESEVPSARPRRRGVPIDECHRHARPRTWHRERAGCVGRLRG